LGASDAILHSSSGGQEAKSEGDGGDMDAGSVIPCFLKYFLPPLCIFYGLEKPLLQPKKRKKGLKKVY
jgi:hypothetical protein